MQFLPMFVQYRYGSALKELEAFYNIAECSLLAHRGQKRNSLLLS